MRTRRHRAGFSLALAIPILVAAIAIVVLVVWLTMNNQPVEVQVRAPAAPTRPVTPSPSAQPATPPAAAPTAQPAQSLQPAQVAAAPQSNQPAAPVQGGGSAGSGSGSWPWFRGPMFNDISPEKVGLARSWPASGPKKLWSVKLGRGHAGPAVRNGRVYVLDYDESAHADTLRCLSLDDGREIWKQSYPVQLKYNHGLSRTTPSVTDKYVVSIGPRANVMCCNASSGEVIWRKDLVKEYGAKIPSWYASQSPLIDGSRIIIAPGGSALMIAVDIASGAVAWTTPNPDGWQMTYASITPLKLAGARAYVYPTTGGVIAVSAGGKLLWKFPGWRVSTANCPNAVDCGGGLIFLSGGYNAGSMMIKAGGSSVSQVFKLDQRTFGSHQHTPILYDKHLFGVNLGDKQFTCLDLKGNSVWSSGHTAQFGLGPYLLAEGMFYVLSENGTLALVEASTSGYKELARAQVVGGNAWAPMALAGGRLILRDETTMVCLDVKNP